LLDIETPSDDWNIAAIIVRDRSAAPVIPPLPKPVSRPQITHTPPKITPPNQPITLTISVKDARTVRLHYRALNQLAQFKTIEKPAAASVIFTIPADDLPPNWDLLYYFEILNRENSGWFEPDPLLATPYHVVKVTNDTPPDRSAGLAEAARPK
jgi:hypothetical protein